MGVYSELDNLEMILDVGEDGKRTYCVRRRRDNPTQIHVVARWHASICIRGTSLHPNTSSINTSSHYENRNDNNSLPMETATRHNRGSSNNHNCSATDNDDLVVATTSFSAATVATIGRDKHLVLGSILSSVQHPMSNYQFSPIAGMSQIQLFAQQPSMFNTHFQKL